MEGRHVFISILAALIAYAAGAVAALPIIMRAGDFLSDLIAAQLSAQGAPQDVVNEAIKVAQPIAAAIPYLIPVSIVLNAALIGALIGMLYSHTINKTGNKALAVLTASTAHAALTAAGLAVIHTEGLWETISKYTNPYTLLTPAITYAIALAALTKEGPWQKLANDTPTKY